MAKKVSEFTDLKQECEVLLRQGHISPVQKKLEKVTSSQIPRHHLADLCTLARRAHLWKLSLRWLHPIVRPKVSGGKGASSREIAEYAMALQRAGALQEAEDLLNVVDATADPRVFLSKAFVRMARWDYLHAEEFLSQYVKAESLTDYERLVGKVNWLAALVNLKDSRVEKLLPELEEQLRKGQHQLLLSNCLEISAQYAISKSDWAEAQKALQKAQDLVDEGKTLDTLFIQKWKSIVSALENQDAGKLSEFRAQALQLGHWETLRALDFYQARLAPDSHWTTWVYYGTPHLEFRKHLEKIRSFPEETWIRRTSEAKIKIDPWFPGHQEGDLSHRCFVLLLQDFYRPLRVGEAFGPLFPDEYYNPRSSPNRVHQTMTRLRKWLGELNLPFQFIENEGTYSLRIPESVQLLCRKKIPSLEETRFLFDRYESRLGSEFTSEELAHLVGQSQSTLQRTIKKGVEKNILEKSGQGRFTSYKILTSSRK